MIVAIPGLFDTIYHIKRVIGKCSGTAKITEHSRIMPPRGRVNNDNNNEENQARKRKFRSRRHKARRSLAYTRTTVFEMAIIKVTKECK